MSCIVAGPVAVAHQYPSWPLAAAGAGGDGDDDPVFPLPLQPRSVHEADLVPINVAELRLACEACKMAFATAGAVRAHHLNNPNLLFLTMRVDPRHRRFILIESPPHQYGGGRPIPIPIGRPP